MRIFFLLLGLFFSGSVEASLEQKLYDYNLKMADSLYQHHDFDRNLPLAIQYYKNAFDIDAQKAEVYWKLARALWVRQEKINSKQQKRNILKEAKFYMKQAIVNYPQNTDIRLWNAIINGTNLLHSGLLKSLLFLTDNIKEDLEFVISQRQNSERALCALGVYYLKLPTALGGDLAKSIALFQQSLAANPLFHRANLFLAKAYFKNHQARLAKQNLAVILQSKRSEEIGFLVLFQQEALLLLEQW